MENKKQIDIMFEHLRGDPHFLGRNGSFKMKGIEVTKVDEVIYIEPVTSKGNIGRCRLEIPVDEVERLIIALRQVKWERSE